MFTANTAFLAFTSMAMGAVLAKPFSVLILVPVISLALLLVICVGIVRGDPIGSAALHATVVGLGLQLGYSLTTWVATRVAVSRTSRRPLDSLTDGLGHHPVHR